MNFKTIIISLFSLFCITLSCAQDYHFSQFYAAPIVFNPSETGMMNGDYRIATNYRDQWRNVTNPFVTQQGSFDFKLLRDRNQNNKFAFGVLFLNDKAGTSEMGGWYTGATFSTSVTINEKTRISFGLRGGNGGRSINTSYLTWDNQWTSAGLNTNYASAETKAFEGKYVYLDFGGGATAYYKKNDKFDAFGGLSFNHITRPKVGFFKEQPDKLKFNLTLNGGANIKIRGTNKTLIPKFLVMQQGPNIQITPGMLMKYNLGMESIYTHANRQSAIYFGGFYRVRDALILSMLYDHKHFFSFGLSYDVNLSKLTPSTYAMGGFEITLMHVGTFGKKGKSESSVN